tara:strand:- start:111 stop:281 length:171 start_codon:yes stop_codon:yes gene_type:complete
LGYTVVETIAIRFDMDQAERVVVELFLEGSNTRGHKWVIEEEPDSKQQAEEEFVDE